MLKRFLLLMASTFLPALNVHAQDLVKDIDLGATGAAFNGSMAVLDDTLYFTCHGDELWKSDGTGIGTVLVADLVPGSKVSPGPNFMAGSGKKIFFTFSSPANGGELWVSDGTKSGTRVTKEIAAGAASAVASAPICEVAGTLYFSADSGNLGYELWKSDGTTEGTRLVKDIFPGLGNGSKPISLTRVGDRLFFSAFMSAQDSWLFSSDGTDSGTVAVKKVGAHNLKAMNGILYFTVFLAETGEELWRSNGTDTGTYMIKDINPGYMGSSIYELQVIGDRLFFSADDGSHGLELWKSDGTSAGTLLVKDMNAGSASSIVGTGVLSKGRFFFGGLDSAMGFELWVSDGTDSGTHVVKDLIDGSNDVGNLVAFHDKVYFSAKSDLYPVSVWWETDGTGSGTRPVLSGSQPALTYPILPHVAGDNLLYVATDAAHGQELRKVAGGVSGLSGNPGPGRPDYSGGLHLEISDAGRMTYAYSLPLRTRVQARLFDSRGRLAAKFMDEVQGPGAHSLALPAIAVKGGEYLLELRASGLRETVKITGNH